MNLRLPPLLLAAALVAVAASSATAETPRRPTAAKVKIGSEVNSARCHVTELTILADSLRIKCHIYPANKFAVHKDHPYYWLPFKGQRDARVAAVMDVLIHAREHSETIGIGYGGKADPPSGACKPDDCRMLLTVGLVKQ